MNIKLICPLGSKCENIKDEQSYKCRWYIALKGKNPQSDNYIDEWGCAIEWLPILLIENAQTNRGQTAAIESLRNEMIKGQSIFNEILYDATERKKLL